MWWGWVRARPLLAAGLALVVAAAAVTTAVGLGRAVRGALRVDSRSSIHQASGAWRAGSTLMIADRRPPAAAAAAAGPVGLGPAAAVPPVHFTTLPPGSPLPSDQQCAAWVRAAPLAENKRMNRGYNQAGGQSLGTGFFSGDDPRANSRIAVRVDGAFTGTTRQVLRWAACKWGIDEDIVYAQAARESWWHQTNQGDWASDPSACPPGHGLGVDGRAGLCPQSWGILQNRYPYERGSWPGIATSTAMNADTAYAIWRSCFEGYETWLNTVDRGRPYAAGDAWGCVGRWFAGRWHTAPADQYTAAVQDYQRQRIWESTGFQEP
jgi:autotransporter family porin